MLGLGTSKKHSSMNCLGCGDLQEGNSMIRLSCSKSMPASSSIWRTFCCPASRYFSMSKKEQWARELLQMSKEEDLQIRTPATAQEALIIKLRNNLLSYTHQP